MTWLHLLLLALFTFRLTLAFSKEGGPAGIFRRTRALLTREVPALKEGVECPWCWSVYCGLAVAGADYVLQGNSIYELLLLAGALSGAAVIANQAWTRD